MEIDGEMAVDAAIDPASAASVVAPEATRARGDVMIGQIAGGRNDGHDVAQVGLEGVPDADFKLPLPRRR